MAEAQSEDVCDEEIREIKKIRKKLRQIEKLERLNRNLNKDEENKLNMKHELRTILSELVAELKRKGIDKSINISSSTINDSQKSTIIINNNSLEQQTKEIHSTDAIDNNYNHLDPLPSPGGLEEDIISISTSTPTTNRSGWIGNNAIVTPLTGHNDAICTVDSNGDILMTGSRDTTIKVWDLHGYCELRSLGFHSNAVTCVKILPDKDELLLSMISDEEQSQPVIIGQYNNCCFGISGSLDCNIVFWNLETGQLIHKVYTFSSIQCFVYHSNHVYVGSDGGKIDVWRISDGVNIYTLSKYGWGITCMALNGEWLYCGRTKGSIQVWNINTRRKHFEWCNNNNNVLPDNDDTDSEDGERDTVTTSRCVRCICYHGNKIYWGDDGTNLKMLEWSEANGAGDMKKFSNHIHEFGSSGAVTVCTNKKVLLTAGYDLDTGHSLINIRRLSSDHEYMCTIQYDCISYISCMCIIKDNDNGITIATGGQELFVFDIYKNKTPKIKNKAQKVVPCTYVDQLNLSYSTDEDSFDVNDSLTKLHVSPLPSRRSTVGVVDPNQESWLQWMYENCIIL